ncbi:unnamed protein product [Moneuplotes crassus]|uniref:Uncharacterized protein n=1 Tax=Euplotes crassus TaxID=5936 RepID=A0AAD2D393_EUPCR|nr:unnamed protein product [Moneuplotes crassus]
MIFSRLATFLLNKLLLKQCTKIQNFKVAIACDLLSQALVVFVRLHTCPIVASSFIFCIEKELYSFQRIPKGLWEISHKYLKCSFTSSNCSLTNFPCEKNVQQFQSPSQNLTKIENQSLNPSSLSNQTKHICIFSTPYPSEQITPIFLTKFSHIPHYTSPKIPKLLTPIPLSTP